MDYYVGHIAKASSDFLGAPARKRQQTLAHRLKLGRGPGLEALEQPDGLPGGEDISASSNVQVTHLH
jgi:hypothetical protein